MKNAVLATVVSLGAVLACGAALAQGTATNASTATTAPAGDAARGQQLFTADGCYQCHGYVGQGSIRTGPTLAPKPAPWPAFTAQLREPADKMPPFTDKVLSDAQMADIYAYLSSIPPAQKPDDIPLLKLE